MGTSTSVYSKASDMLLEQKVSAYKYEDLSWNPQFPCKSWVHSTNVCAPSGTCETKTKAFQKHVVLLACISAEKQKTDSVSNKEDGEHQGAKVAYSPPHACFLCVCFNPHTQMHTPTKICTRSCTA